MAINYSTPTTSAAIEQALNANPSITPATQAAITQTLGLGPGVLVPVGSVNADGTIVGPPGSPEMLIFDIGTSGGAYTPPSNVQAAIQNASVLVFDTDRSVILNIPAGPQASVNRDSAQSVSVEDTALAARNITEKLAAADQVFDRVVQLGNGNDDVTSLDNRSVRITGSGGNDRIVVSGGNDYVAGGDGRDNVIMGGGRDTAVVGWGVDTVDGGTGWNTIMFSRAGTDTANPAGTGATTPGQPGVGDWSITKVGDKLVITSTAGAQNGAELQNVDFVQFGDGGLGKQFSVAVVNNESDANVARLYQTVLDRSADEGGLQYWLDQSNSGLSLSTITDFFLTSPESNLVVAQTNAALINQIYENAFGRTPDAGGYAFWLNALNDGLSRSVFVDYIATSDEAKTTITNVQVFTDWV